MSIPNKSKAGLSDAFDLAAMGLEEAASKAAALFVSIYRGLEQRPVAPPKTRAALRATFSGTLVEESKAHFVLPVSDSPPEIATARKIGVLKSEIPNAKTVSNETRGECNAELRSWSRTLVRHSRLYGRNGKLRKDASEELCHSNAPALAKGSPSVAQLS
jgi:hypothetical protein